MYIVADIAAIAVIFLVVWFVLTRFFPKDTA
jgi:hypothetical protein